MLRCYCCSAHFSLQLPHSESNWGTVQEQGNTRRIFESVNLVAVSGVRYNARMKYSLRSLMIATIVAPPVLGGGYALWRILPEDVQGGLVCLTAFFVLTVAVPSVIWVLIPIRQ